MPRSAGPAAPAESPAAASCQSEAVVCLPAMTTSTTTSTWCRNVLSSVEGASPISEATKQTSGRNRNPYWYGTCHIVDSTNTVSAIVACATAPTIAADMKIETTQASKGLGVVATILIERARRCDHTINRPSPAVNRATTM